MNFLSYLTPDMITGIVIAIAIIFIIGFLWYKGKKKEALTAISYLVDFAEERFGAGTGELKYNYVVSTLYPSLPAIVRVFLTPEKVDNLIETEVNKLQDKLKEKLAELDTESNK